MAYDYEQTKKQYESLNDEQKKQFANMKGGNVQQFLDQYNQEKNSQNTQQSGANSSDFNNQGTTTEKKVYNQNTGYYETQNNNQDFNKNQNVSPDLDQSKFNESPGKITVKEGTAAQTGQPDYQISSEARDREITDNLNYYWENNKDYFSSRDKFNNIFHYNDRNDSQKAILDSYWKKKEDMDTATQYNSGKSISTGMKNGEITTDQLNYIKEYNNDAYREWQQLQEDEIKLRIVNDIVPPLLEDISTKLQGMMNSLGIQPQDALDIEGVYNDTMRNTGAWQTLEDANSTVNEIKAVNDKKTAIMNRYASSTGGTVSDALAAARMAKAIAPYNEQLQGLQYQYQDYANLFSQKQAAAYQAAQVRQAQAQENQRIWNQRVTALGFAADALNWRTPEQKAQLELQTKSIENEMSLLQQSRENDLSLYNKYATAKLENQLNAELTDLSVKDPTQLRANLNNVLSSYYSQYGDIIQRPQSQVVDDVLAYAEKNGVSVAEALKKNFIEPLQNKQEYKNAIASKYAAPTSTTSAGYSKITINGKDYLTMGGKIIDPATLGIGTGNSTTKPYNLVSTQTMESGIDTFSIDKNKGDYYGECGKFVNDYLVSIGATDKNNRYFGNEDVSTRASRCNTQIAAKGAVAVFDYGIYSSDKINHGHVAVVTKTYKDGSFDVIESNYPSGGVINTRHVEKDDANLQGFINPSLGVSSSQGYNTKDPYSSVSGHTSGGAEINAGGWVTALEKKYGSKLTDKQKERTLQDYGLTEMEYDAQEKRYMDYIETQEMVKSLLGVKEMAEKLKTWADDDANKNLKGWMDIDIAEKGYAGFWEYLFTKNETIESIQEGKALYDNLMSNAGFQKYLDMKNNGAQFGIMTDSEWKKVDSSVAPLKWEQKDSLFLENLNSMISGYNEVLAQLGYDFSEGDKPESAKDVEMTDNQGIAGDNVTLQRMNNGRIEYSLDGGKTRL